MALSPIRQACEAVGGQVKLAELLNVTPQAVNLWVGKDRVPAERVIEIERATNCRVTRHDLRPDLYPLNDHTSLLNASKEAAA